MKCMDKHEFEQQNVFGTGAANTAYAKFFIGQSFLNPLTDPKTGLFLANVTFEPGCRNNWHIHHAAKGGRPAAGLYRRRRLVPGRGQTCRQPDPRHRDHHPGQRQALARCQGRQLVQPHCCGSSRRRLQQRVVRARYRRRVRQTERMSSR